MNLIQKIILLTVASTCGVSNATPNVLAKSFKVLDISTGTIIAEKNSSEKTEIASLTKVMTAYVAFSELKNGTLHLNDEVLITKNAWRTKGSSMFIDAGKKVTVDDLLKGIIIISGNDASIALAEHIAGSEDKFVDLMNNYAKALGMNNTVFANSTGLPTKRSQYSTAEDLATLTNRLFKDFPEYTHLFKEKDFTYNDIYQPNRNRLLSASPSYNGLKTGYTVRSGYSLISSFKEDGREIITIILNAKSAEDRFMAAKELTNFGFRRYKNVSPILKDTPVTSIPVYYGRGGNNEIAVYAEKTLTVTLELGIEPIADEIHLVAKLNKNGNNDSILFAPISKNYIVGEITAYHKDKEIGTINLVTKDLIEEGNPFKKVKDWVKLKFIQ